MMRDPKTEPIPAPEPATPTVAAPAPMNLAAESISDLAAEVDRRAWDIGAGLTFLAAVRASLGQMVRRARADILKFEHSIFESSFVPIVKQNYLHIFYTYIWIDFCYILKYSSCLS